MVVIFAQSCPTLCDPIDPTRLLCPWDFPGKNTGVDCHSLLQRIFLTQESNRGLLHCRRTLNRLSYTEELVHINIPNRRATERDSICCFADLAWRSAILVGGVFYSKCLSFHIQSLSSSYCTKLCTLEPWEFWF